MAEGTEKPRVAAVLLAAGESTRMGEPKALLPWGGQPLIAHQVAALHEAGYAPLVVEIMKFFKTGIAPVSAEETIEMFAFMEAADESKRQGGAPIDISELIKRHGG